MKRFLENYSSFLSFLAVAVFAFGIWSMQYLAGRATWSGEAAPVAWSEGAKADDVFQIEGHTISYWGDPEARYSSYATRKRRPPVAIVVHFTAAKPVKNLVTYGHVSDPNRGGASFGYHFYIGRDGHIVQGAPLSRRTNHIKFKTNKKRRDTARHLWSGNTLAVSLVGGCDPLMRPRWGAWQQCSEEYVTGEQLQAGLTLIRALQAKFALKCDEVYGHGDLQFDRESFEGMRLSRLARGACPEEDEVAAMPPVPVPAGQRTRDAKAAAAAPSAEGRSSGG